MKTPRWVVEFGSGDLYVREFEDDTASVGNFIAKVHPQNGTTYEPDKKALANAVLIASAPDLRRALNTARMELRNAQTELEYGRDERRSKNAAERLARMLDSEDRAIKAAQKAIEAIDADLKKARGE